MNTNKPLLFLDVDGVINRDVSNGVARKRHYRSWSLNVMTYPYRVRIHVDIDDIARLRLLSEHFDLAWGTSWEREASYTLAPRVLHLPAGLPYIGYDGSDGTVVDANDGSITRNKLPGVMRLARDNHFAWVDDVPAYADMLSEYTEESQKTLMVLTDPTVGLTDAHVETLIAWAKDLAAAEA